MVRSYFFKPRSQYANVMLSSKYSSAVMCIFVLKGKSFVLGNIGHVYPETAAFDLILS